MITYWDEPVDPDPAWDKEVAVVLLRVTDVWLPLIVCVPATDASRYCVR
jgi:hypothetical protein